jgi:hypothetical protein
MSSNPQPTPSDQPVTPPPAVQPGEVPRGWLARFLRWLFCARTLGRFLFAVFTAATALAFFYIEEGWRGERAWRRHQSEMAAKGRQLDFHAFVPPKVPDDQNFATTPLLAPLLDFLPGTQTWRDSNAVQRIEQQFSRLPELAKQKGFKMGEGKYGRWEAGERVDLIALLGPIPSAPSVVQADASVAPRIPTTQEEAARLILDLIAQASGPMLDEVASASQRPYCRFDIDYDYAPPMAIHLPHLAKIKALARQLSWRAHASLALGKTNQAFDDVLLGLYLADGLKNEPILISHLVRIACRALMNGVTWEGMVDHRWSDAQLQRLQTGLEKDDFPLDVQRVLMGERSLFGVRTLELLISGQGGFYLDDLLDQPCTAKPRHRLMPTGWLYFETVNLNWGYESLIAPFDDWRGGKLDAGGFLSALAQAEKQVGTTSGWQALWQHRLLSGMFLPAVSRAQQKALLAQVQSDLVWTACALERHYLAHRRYPESLAALVPSLLAQLPKDLMSGQPLCYQPSGPGSYVLYSVGRNGVDDRGQVSVRKAGLINYDEGDWTWYHLALGVKP